MGTKRQTGGGTHASTFWADCAQAGCGKRCQANVWAEGVPTYCGAHRSGKAGYLGQVRSDLVAGRRKMTKAQVLEDLKAGEYKGQATFRGHLKGGTPQLQAGEYLDALGVVLPVAQARKASKARTLQRKGERAVKAQAPAVKASTRKARPKRKAV